MGKIDTVQAGKHFLGVPVDATPEGIRIFGAGSGGVHVCGGCYEKPDIDFNRHDGCCRRS